MFKKIHFSKKSLKESQDNSFNDLTKNELEILSSTLRSIIENENTLINNVLKRNLNEVKKAVEAAEKERK